MPASTHYVKGKDHAHCQDYAQVIDGKVIISDGCSTGKVPGEDSHTDLGARFLVHSAGMFSKADREYMPMIMNRAKMAAVALEVPEEVLNATLLLIGEELTHYRVETWGDGVVFAQTHDGEIRYWNTEFSAPAPYYPRYTTLDGEYEKQFPDCRRTVTDKAGRVIPVYDLAYEGYDLSKNSFKLVGIATDGIKSFYSTDRSGIRIPIPFPIVLQRLLDIRSFAGNFVERELTWMLEKEFYPQGIFHYDDLAVGMIGEEDEG